MDSIDGLGLDGIGEIVRRTGEEVGDKVEAASFVEKSEVFGRVVVAISRSLTTGGEDEEAGAEAEPPKKEAKGLILAIRPAGLSLSFSLVSTAAFEL
jgi:hypothetical protein